MGNPEAGSGDCQSQTEYELQPQEHQYEATHEALASHDQNQFQPQAQPNDALAQQQFQPPQAQQQRIAQPQPTQYPPPQPNQAYSAQPGQPIQFGPQNNQLYYNGLNQPGVYPQTFPAKPVPFPPPSPQSNQTYLNGLNQQPGAYPQYGQQPMPGQQTPVNNFPPTPPQYGIPLPSQGTATAWTSGLFDCMNDPMNALITACFPCLTFGQLAEIVDDGHTSCGTSGMLYGGIAFCIGLPCIMSCTYRTKLRAKFGLPEAPAPDWITHFLCEWCALCQEYRELQARGWDPSIGWQGNVAKKNMNMQQVNMTPPMNQRMMA